MQEHEMEISVKGVDLMAYFGIGNVGIGSTGIGHYEFWGAKGYDKGVSYVEEFDVEDLVVWSDRRKDYVKPSKRLAEKLLDNIYDDETLKEELMKEVSSYAEPDEDSYAD